jgi:hypothetical protein
MISNHYELERGNSLVDNTRNTLIKTVFLENAIINLKIS